MTCAVYASRKFLLTVLALLSLVLAAWGYFFLPMTGTSLALRIATGTPIVAALLACIVSLLARDPVIRVDETGITYQPKRFPKIEWADVLGVERAPLLEPTPDGLINHSKDGWRPVSIFVTASDRYLRRLPAMLRQRLIAEEPADSVRFQIVFMGLSPMSAEVYDCICRHLDRHGPDT